MIKRQIELNTHISGKFNQELENLTNSVLTMGGEVEQQLIQALTAIRENNAKLAEKVVINDARIDSMQTQIDNECMRIIAKRNPTASDLRLIMTVTKATVEIERIGDEIERMAKLVTSDSVPSSELIKSGMLSLGDKIVLMMRGTFDAFARQDEAAAVAIYDQDNAIDKQHKELLRQTADEIQADERNLHEWFEVLWSIRAIERIGDRCKNICEFVVFMTYGKDTKLKTIKKNIKKLRK